MYREDISDLWYEENDKKTEDKREISCPILSEQQLMRYLCPIQEVRFVTSEKTIVELYPVPLSSPGLEPIGPSWGNQIITIYPGLNVFRWRETWIFGPQGLDQHRCLEFHNVSKKVWLHNGQSKFSTYGLRRTLGYDWTTASDNTIIIADTRMHSLVHLACQELGLSKSVDIFGLSLPFCKLHRNSLVLRDCGSLSLVSMY